MEADSMTWWDNAEEGRAARYEDPRDYIDHPTLAECEADEREIAALRRAVHNEAGDVPPW